MSRIKFVLHQLTLASLDYFFFYERNVIFQVMKLTAFQLPSNSSNEIPLGTFRCTLSYIVILQIRQTFLLTTTGKSPLGEFEEESVQEQQDGKS